MSHVLDDMICSNRLHLLGKGPLEPPLTCDEQKILNLLQTLDEKTAFQLRDCIESAVIHRHMEAVRAGIRFGVRLAAELTEPPEEIG